MTEKYSKRGLFHRESDQIEVEIVGGTQGNYQLSFRNKRTGAVFACSGKDNFRLIEQIANHAQLLEIARELEHE